MIKITGIKIKDFGRHRAVDDSFAGHVIGLTGPNGLGKSTVLQAIQYGLTGTIDHPDPLKSFIRRSSEAKPPKGASVELSFIADGKAGKITRRITKTSSSRKLEWEGLPIDEKLGERVPLTSDKAVSDLLFNILGVDKKAINSTVFIRQGEMASMFGKDTERRDFYIRLLMLGHMDKIGDIVENHRKTVADSLQDLQAVKDAAESAYEEALSYLEDRKGDLSALMEPKAELVILRDIQGRFGEQAEAEKSCADARAALSGILGAGVGSEFIEESKVRITEGQSRLDLLTQTQQTYVVTQTALNHAERDSAAITQQRSKFDDLAAATKNLEDNGTLGDDPQLQIDTATGQLADYAELQKLNVDLPTLENKLEPIEKELAERRSEKDSVEIEYNQARESFAAKKSDLDMRKSIRDDLAKQGSMAGCDCPVCGSTSPDAEYLDKTITEGQSSLDAIQGVGAQYGSRMRDLAAGIERLQTSSTSIKAQVATITPRVSRLRVSLVTFNAEAAEATLADAKVRKKKWEAHDFELRRLTEQLKVCRDVVGSTLPPTDNDVSRVKQELSDCQAAFTKVSWKAEDDAERLKITGEIRKWREEIEKVQTGASALDAANKRLGAVESALVEKLVHCDQGTLATTPGAAVTIQDVQDAVAGFEEQQATYDESKGRVDASSDAVKAASGKICEIDLRVAEQKHRLKLSEDLGRLRDTFKPNGASLEYLDYEFGQIARLAADYLAESQADFMVAASPDLPLAFEFLRTDRPDEVWMPQNRMSGGQKVRLAVATLRAIHAMVMPNVGLLVLDEPTTHLDAEAQKNMGEMLGRIGAEGTLQMIVCDHSPILVDAFSDTIEIQA